MSDHRRSRTRGRSRRIDPSASITSRRNYRDPAVGTCPAIIPEARRAIDQPIAELQRPHPRHDLGSGRDDRLRIDRAGNAPAHRSSRRLRPRSSGRRRAGRSPSRRRRAVRLRFLETAVTADNYRELLTPLLTAGEGQGFCVNLSVDTSSVDIMRLCRELDVLYIDTVVEPWPGFYYDPSDRQRHCARTMRCDRP